MRLLRISKFKLTTILFLNMTFMLCSCGKNTDNAISQTITEKGSDYSIFQEETDTEVETENYLEEMKSENVKISMSYLPIEYRDGILIVQRNEDTELFGAISNSGDIVFEPVYDNISFSEMQGQLYLRVQNENTKAIYTLLGEKVTNDYEDIASAGDLGWLIRQDGKTKLIDENEQLIKEFKDTYTQIFGNQYLVHCQGELADSQKNLNITLDKNGVIHNSTYYADGIYDLDENPLIKAKDGLLDNITLFRSLEEGQYFIARCFKDAQSVINGIYSKKGEMLVEDVSDDEVIREYPDKHKLISFEDGSGMLDQRCDFFLIDLAKKTKKEINPLEGKESYGYIPELAILYQANNGFYSFYNMNGEKLSDERYKRYKSHGKDWMVVQNIDEQWGLVNKDLEVIIDFGRIKETSQGDFFTNSIACSIDGVDGRYMDNSSDGNFSCYTGSESGGYTFYNFVVGEADYSFLDSFAEE